MTISRLLFYPQRFAGAMVRASRQSPDLSAAGLGPPRFGLRGLLWTITTLAVLFAVLASIGAMWALMVILLVLLVAAHVLGNWMGTTLRDSTPRPRMHAARPYPRPAPATNRLQRTEPTSYAPWILAALTALLGGLLGGLMVALQYRPAITAFGILMASLGAAMIGGLGGYLIGCFVGTSHQTWREAANQASPPERPR